MPARRPRILVDFDGVWTTVDGQAAAVDAARGRQLTGLSGLPPSHVAACEAAVAAALTDGPLEHGWRLDGRLTAYADEDPFLRHNALCCGIGILAGRGEPACRELRDALLARGHADLGALGSAIFLEASHDYLADHGHDLLPAAPDVLRALLALADVTFCTNFAPDAVAHSWEPRGFAFAGPQATPGLHLRGAARKQVLTADPPRQETFGARPVAVDRGHYREALAVERPDVVVGDVFSLDLALPLVMGREEPASCRPLCLLARTRFTPAWSLELARDGGLERLRLLPALADLVPLAAGLTHGHS